MNFSEAYSALVSGKTITDGKQEYKARSRLVFYVRDSVPNGINNYGRFDEIKSLDFESMINDFEIVEE